MKQFVPISFALAAAGAYCALAQSGSSADDSVKREGRYWVRTMHGNVSAASMERFKLDSIGNVIVRGDASGNAVYTLKARVRARDAREARLKLRQYEVRTRSQGEWLFFGVTPPSNIVESPELQISVPRTLRQVVVDTRAGNVQVSRLDGELVARSAAGRIGVDAIKGPADVRTGGGDIEVGAVAGPVRCYSGGGVIRVQNAGGESWFDTAGGEILVQQVLGAVHAATAGGNIRIDRATGMVFARTAAGLIEVQQAGGPVTAESSGGAIQVNAANGGVRCESAGGAIRLRNVGGTLRASTAIGSILAELLSANRIQDSTLTTNGGDITVFISSNLPLTVLARNESAGSTGRIISDFPEIRLKTIGFPGLSPSVAEGALNGGGPVLHLNVLSGTIYLRRQR